MRSGIARLRKRTVLVHMKNDDTFKGILLHSFRDCLVLTQSSLLDAQEKGVGGEAVLPRENIAWLQVLGG